MFGNIGQRLLGNPEHGGGVRFREFQFHCISDAQAARNTAALGETTHQPFNRRNQSQIVEQHGPQIRGHAPRCSDCAVQQSHHVAQLLANRLQSTRSVFTHPERIHLQRRQRLRKLVVKLSRETGLFFFPDGIGRDGEGMMFRRKPCPISQRQGRIKHKRLRDRFGFVKMTVCRTAIYPDRTLRLHTRLNSITHKSS